MAGSVTAVANNPPPSGHLFYILLRSCLVIIPDRSTSTIYGLRSAVLQISLIKMSLTTVGHKLELIVGAYTNNSLATCPLHNTHYEGLYSLSSVSSLLYRYGMAYTRVYRSWLTLNFFRLYFSKKQPSARPICAKDLWYFILDAVRKCFPVTVNFTRFNCGTLDTRNRLSHDEQIAVKFEIFRGVWFYVHIQGYFIVYLIAKTYVSLVSSLTRIGVLLFSSKNKY